MVIKIIILIGFQASSKSTFANKLLNKYPKNTVILSRDIEGGAIIDLLPKIETHIKNKKTIILDNTHLTKESRAPFINIAKKNGIPIHAIYMDTTIEDCQIRTIKRMYEKYNQIFFTGKAPKNHPATKDPQIFPSSVLFTSRKKLEIPSINEGFDKIKIMKIPPPKWDGRIYRKKAIFFDIDGTLRKTEHLINKYPTKPSEVILIRPREEMINKLEQFRNEGYLLFGISNQSGIAKKNVSEEDVRKCFEQTQYLLGLNNDNFPISYCPHSAFPLTCYCRKPQIGLPIERILQYKLNPKKCIFIGDMKTDETTAMRLNIKFINIDDFWKK